jgi:hypothetical protein
MFTFRLTIVWSPSTICDAVTIGRFQAMDKLHVFVSHYFIVNQSEAAMVPLADILFYQLSEH